MTTRLRRFAIGLWKEWLRPMLPVIVTICAIRSSLADWNDVPTGSMRPTILEGDRLWVNKLAYDLKVPFTTWHLAEWGEPQRGDIVVFYSPHDGTRLVKRVIALAGDTVEMRGGVILLNGEPLRYATADRAGAGPDTGMGEVRFTELLPDHSHRVQALSGVAAARDFAPITIPADHYFMLGDNRDNSFDSRFYGPVKRDRILGRSRSVVLSFKEGNWLQPRWERWFSPLD